MIAKIAVGIAIAFAILGPLFFFCLVRFAPNPEFRLQSLADRSDERLWYRHKRSAEILSAIVCVPVATFGWYRLLRSLAVVFSGTPPDARFAVQPGYHYWLLIAIFLGVLTASFFVDVGMRMWIGAEWGRFREIARRRFPWNEQRVNLVFGLVFSVIPLAGVLIGFDTYATYHDDHIVIDGPFSLHERRYRYENIRALYSVQCLENLAGMRDEPHHAIEFDDGYSWTTRTNLRAPEPAMDGELFDWLSMKTQKPIESILTFD